MKKRIDQHPFVDDEGVESCAFCFDSAGHADRTCADDDEVVHGAKLRRKAEAKATKAKATKAKVITKGKKAVKMRFRMIQDCIL